MGWGKKRLGQEKDTWENKKESEKLEMTRGERKKNKRMKITGTQKRERVRETERKRNGNRDRARETETEGVRQSKRDRENGYIFSLSVTRHPSMNSIASTRFDVSGHTIAGTCSDGSDAKQAAVRSALRA